MVHLALAFATALVVLPAAQPARAPSAPPQDGPQASAPQPPGAVPAAWVVRAFRDAAGTPLAGAEVWSSFTLGPESFPLPDATTDANGEARVDLSALRDLSPIEREVVELEAHVVHAGFRASRRLTQLRWLSTATDTVPESVLAPGRSVFGRVLDADGRPVGGARVQVGRWDPEDGWSENLEAAEGGLDVTEPGGRFVFAWDGEAVRHLAVEHPRVGAVRVEVSADDPRIGTPPGLEVRLEPPVRFVTGTVRASDGSPIGRPRLFAEPVESGATPFGFTDELFVGADGAFELACPVAGEWALSTNYADVAKVEPPAVDVEVRLPGRYAVVRVVDAAGRAVRGRQPRIQALSRTAAGQRPDFRGRAVGLSGVLGGSWVDPGGSGDGTWTGALQADGTYAARGLVLGTESAWLGERVFELGSGEVVANVELALREAASSGSLDVRVLDAAGAPLARWRASLVSELTGIEWMAFSEAGRHRETGHGVVHEALRWYAGRYRVVVAPHEDQFFLPVDAVHDLTAGGPNALAFRSPGTGGRVRLVTDVEGEWPRPLPRLELTREGEAVPLPSIPLARGGGERDVLWTATSTGGRPAETRLLEPGRYRWRVLGREGELDAGALEVRAGEVVEQVLDLDG